MATQTSKPARKPAARKLPASRRAPAAPVRRYPAGTLLLIGLALMGWQWAPFLSVAVSRTFDVAAIAVFVAAMIILYPRARAEWRRQASHIRAGRR